MDAGGEICWALMKGAMFETFLWSVWIFSLLGIKRMQFQLSLRPVTQSKDGGPVTPLLSLNKPGFIVHDFKRPLLFHTHTHTPSKQECVSPKKMLCQQWQPRHCVCHLSLLISVKLTFNWSFCPFLLFLIRSTVYSTVQPNMDTFGPWELHTTSSDDLNRTWFIEWDEPSLVELGDVRTKQAKTRGTRLDPLRMDRKHLTEGETSSIAVILTSLIPPHLFCGCFWCSAGEFRGNRAERGQRFPQRKTEETPELLGVTGRSICRWLDYVWGHGEGRLTANQPS